MIKKITGSLRIVLQIKHEKPASENICIILSMMKISLLFISLFFTYSYCSSQNCSVEIPSLKGSYTGACKNGKPNGKGKAVGTDSYEGNFVAGVPDGQGIYRWSNGNEFTGWFVKGLKDGIGKLVYKRADQKDSVVEGLWKKDIYSGKPLQAYRVIFQSKAIIEVEAEKKEDGFNRITFLISTTSGTARTLEGDEYPKMKVDDVHVLSGNIGRMYSNDAGGRKTETVIENVQFPVRMKVIIGTEELEIEFMQAGNFNVNVRINN
jgi:hypothetical protein